MTLFIDGKERAKWDADFSNVNEPVTITAAANSVVSVKQVNSISIDPCLQILQPVARMCVLCALPRNGVYSFGGHDQFDLHN